MATVCKSTTGMKLYNPKQQNSDRRKNRILLDKLAFVSNRVINSSSLLEYESNSYTVPLDSREFMTHIQKFDNMFKDEAYEQFFNVSYNVAKGIFSETLSQLLTITPESICCELTYDSSFFFTLKKKGYDLYFEQFIGRNDPIASMEVSMTIFKGKEMIFNDSALLSELISELDEQIGEISNDYILSQTHELSY